MIRPLLFISCVVLVLKEYRLGKVDFEASVKLGCGDRGLCGTWEVSQDSGFTSETADDGN